MGNGLSRVNILVLVLIWGLMTDIVFSEEPQIYSSSELYKSPQKVVNDFLSPTEDFSPFQGRVPISRIKKIFEDKKNVQELKSKFEEDCLRGKIAPTSAVPCSKAALALGALGSAGAGDSIIRFLRKNKTSVPSVKKAGLFALGYLGNTQEQKRQEEISLRSMSIPAPSAPVPPSPTPMPSASTVNVPEEIVKCLPPFLRKNFSFSNNRFELCDTPWEVNTKNNRDEIRWGLMSLAQTGSKEAQQVLENLQGPEGTSRHAFIQELIKIHKKASEKNGLLCLNEPENPVCQ